MAALAIALPALLGIGLWQHHNSLAFSNSSFTSVGTFNLLYYRAAVTRHLAQGRENIDAVNASLARRVEERLGNEAGDITSEWKKKYRSSTSRVEAAMRDVALETIAEYPAAFVLATLVGAYQTLIEVWGALSLPGTLWNVALLIAAAIGLWRFLRQRRWMAMLFLLLPCIYFVAGTVLVCTTCMDTRGRVNDHTPARGAGCLRRHAIAQPADSGVGVTFSTT